MYNVLCCRALKTELNRTEYIRKAHVKQTQIASTRTVS